MTQFCDMTFG